MIRRINLIIKYYNYRVTSRGERRNKYQYKKYNCGDKRDFSAAVLQMKIERRLQPGQRGKNFGLQ
jgi:hypothetical protein